MKAFFTGVITGATVGVLVAPDKGSTTRRRLRAQATDVAQFGREQLDELRRILRNPERALQKVREISPRLAETAEKAADAARSVATKVGLGSAAAVNTASRERLMEVDGIGPVLADRIIAGRPYSSPRELVKRGILPESAFENLERELLKAT